MNRLLLIAIIVCAIQTQAFAWPNNLIFTLKPENVEMIEQVETDLPIFKEKDGYTYIGKFAHPDIAELAQGQLRKKGLHTELLAFFRAKPLDLEDARNLVNNYNQQEELTMLSGTNSASMGSITIKKAKDVNSAYFTIQLGVYTRSVRDNFDDEVREVQMNGQYYYFYGKYDSLEISEADLPDWLDKGYSDAFVTGFSLGQKVSAELLDKMMN